MKKHDININTVEWTWKIRRAEVYNENSGLNDVVKSIHWTLNGEYIAAKSQHYLQSASGVFELPKPSDDNFIDIDSVKKSVLKKWLIDSLGVKTINEIKQKVIMKMNRRFNGETYTI